MCVGGPGYGEKTSPPTCYIGGCFGEAKQTDIGSEDDSAFYLDHKGGRSSTAECDVVSSLPLTHVILYISFIRHYSTTSLPKQ